MDRGKGNNQLRPDGPTRPFGLDISPNLVVPTVLPDGNGGFTPCPELLTEEELTHFLRIPEVSNSADYHNVVEHLKRLRKLPRIHICNKTLYPRIAIQNWIERETNNGK